MKILIADDDQDLASLVAFTLGQAGYLVVKTLDGDGALKAFEHEAPDLVVLDINMPRKNGFEMLAEMKSDAELQSLPVVMLTMSEREEDVLRSYKQGACSYVKKPLDLGDFRRVVNQFQAYWTQVARIPAN